MSTVCDRLWKSPGDAYVGEDHSRAEPGPYVSFTSELRIDHLVQQTGRDRFPNSVRGSYGLYHIGSVIMTRYL